MQISVHVQKSQKLTMHCPLLLLLMVFVVQHDFNKTILKSAQVWNGLP